MADRISYELVNAPADSPSEVHNIDTAMYGASYKPKGYERTSTVEQNVNPTGDSSNSAE